MENLQKGTEIAHEECAARIVWAAHILFYLTRHRSHTEHHQPHADSEEYEDPTSDYESEETVILTGPNDSVRQKFLDCVAQLLSPSKGWDSVTAAAIRESEGIIEVDIARNDSFLSDETCANSETIIYCRELEKYLRGNDQDIDSTLASEFELKTMNYSSRRIDYWIDDLRTILTSSQNLHEQWWPGLELAIEKWETVAELILRLDDVEGSRVRNSIVQQAYMCVRYAPVRQLLDNAFGTKISSKLWTRLNFLARPLIDCRLLQLIVTMESQFRHVRISLIPPKPKTSLDAKYHVGICEACTQLGLNSTPEFKVGKLSSLDTEFKQACADSYCQHAEMQLISHYEDGAIPPPTFDYLDVARRPAAMRDLSQSSAEANRHTGKTWHLLSCLGFAMLEISRNEDWS